MATVARDRFCTMRPRRGGEREARTPRRGSGFQTELTRLSGLIARARTFIASSIGWKDLTKEFRKYSASSTLHC